MSDATDHYRFSLRDLAGEIPDPTLKKLVNEVIKSLQGRREFAGRNQIGQIDIELQQLNEFRAGLRDE